MHVDLVTGWSKFHFSLSIKTHNKEITDFVAMKFALHPPNYVNDCIYWNNSYMSVLKLLRLFVDECFKCRYYENMKK